MEKYIITANYISIKTGRLIICHYEFISKLEKEGYVNAIRKTTKEKAQDDAG